MKIILAVFVLIVTLFLSGCIEIQTLVRVDNNGAGTVEETVLISSEIVNMIKQFSESMPPDSGETPEEFNLFNEDELRSQAASFGEGVEYVSGKQISDGKKEGFTAVYSFSDINKLSINENPNSKIPIDAIEEDEDVKEELVQFQFTKGNPSELKINFMNAGEPDTKQEDSTTVIPDSALADSSFSEVVNMMKDMKITLAVEPIGEITETNATHRTGSRITLFDIDFNELLADPQKLEQFKKSAPQNFENFKDIVKDIPGIKVELNQPVIIKFK